MKFILGTKQSMTEIFEADGRVYPATVVAAGPVTITQVKTPDADGYAAVQVGYGAQKESRLSKPVRGHTKQSGSFMTLREFFLNGADGEGEYKVGDTISVEAFKEGDMVVVSGTSKGKGFQGVVKRHGFAGGSRTHGQKHSEREPGSIGGGLRTRVPKGMRMAGRMGSDRVTVKNLKVLRVDPTTNTIVISGAIPGRRGTIVEIKKS